MSGKFFVIEGPDGSGKTTVWEGLKKFLPAEKFLFVRDPGSTVISTKVREILLNPDHSEMSPTTELLLYMAARDQMLNQVIKPALAVGMHVVSDRYIQSTLAYQCDGNMTKGPFVSREAIIGLANLMQHPFVDVLFNLSENASVPLLRSRLANTGKSADRLESNSDEYFQAVLKVYQNLAFSPSCRYHHEIHDIPVTSSPEVITLLISEMIIQKVLS